MLFKKHKYLTYFTELLSGSSEITDVSMEGTNWKKKVTPRYGELRLDLGFVAIRLAL